LCFLGKNPEYTATCIPLPSAPRRSVCSHNYFSFTASLQTQGFNGSFQRIFPNRTSAEEAWQAYKRDGTFPVYGKAPWVVFLGKSQGVFRTV
jgi:hypothetical protein